MEIPEQDMSPVYVTQTRAEDFHLLGYLPHVHVWETGRCIKNRYDEQCGYNDVFSDIRSMRPQRHQEDFINAITGLVNTWLKSPGWGKGSGKTTARLMLAKAIIDGDK